MQRRIRFFLVLLFFALTMIVPHASEVRADGGSNETWAPWRSQFDGTYYSSANCGPAALGIVMAKYDEWWSTNGIRNSTNAYMQDWTYDNGTSWEALAYAAKVRGFAPYGLYGGYGYHEWSMSELLAEVNQGNPVILLVRLKYLPGHFDSSRYVDHYIVFLGLDENGNVIYHDPAGGAYMTMSRETFRFVYGNTASGVNWSDMSLRWVGD